MTHAPKGGCYVADLLAMEERFYAGGQFLPESTPLLKRKAQKIAKAVKPQWGTPNRVLLKPSPVIGVYQIDVEYVKNGYPSPRQIMQGTDKTELFQLCLELAREMGIDLVACSNQAPWGVHTPN